MVICGDAYLQHNIHLVGQHLCLIHKHYRPTDNLNTIEFLLEFFFKYYPTCWISLKNKQTNKPTSLPVPVLSGTHSIKPMQNTDKLRLEYR